MTISLRVSELDGILMKKYARYNNETVSRMIRRIVFAQIERDYKELLERAEALKLM